jgi:hypothetical protein
MILASQNVPASSVPAAHVFVTINFATPASVVAGSGYAIVAYSSTGGSNDYRWHESASTNPYPGGVDYVASSPSGPWTLGDTHDLAFKTYVVPASPQPSAKPTGTCEGQRATIVGTEGNDVRSGTPGRDVMVAWAETTAFSASAPTT